MAVALNIKRLVVPREELRRQRQHFVRPSVSLVSLAGWVNGRTNCAKDACWLQAGK